MAFVFFRPRDTCVVRGTCTHATYRYTLIYHAQADPFLCTSHNGTSCFVFSVYLKGFFGVLLQEQVTKDGSLSRRTQACSVSPCANNTMPPFPLVRRGLSPEGTSRPTRTLTGSRPPPSRGKQAKKEREKRRGVVESDESGPHDRSSWGRKGPRIDKNRRYVAFFGQNEKGFALQLALGVVLCAGSSRINLLLLRSRRRRFDRESTPRNGVGVL